MFGIHLHQGNRCSRYVGEAIDNAVMQPEMYCPVIRARIKQSHEHPSRWVDGGYIRTFAQVAAITSQCKVAQLIRTAMLSGNHMFDMKAQIHSRLREPAIFAAVTCSSPNFLTTRCVY